MIRNKFYLSIFILLFCVSLNCLSMHMSDWRFGIPGYLVEESFRYFYPGKISMFTLPDQKLQKYGEKIFIENIDNNNINMKFPYLQTFSNSNNINNPTFICYDSEIRLVMYYAQLNQLANLINFLQQAPVFLKRKKLINTYTFTENPELVPNSQAQSEEPLSLQGRISNSSYQIIFKSIPVKSNLDSWVYAGPANEANSILLYPILILGQSNVAMQILLENGASPNFLGYSPTLAWTLPLQLTYYYNQLIRCNSALLYAIQQNNIDTAKILLLYGADPNLINGGLITSSNDNKTSTPYLYAINTNETSSSMITLLQEFGGGKNFSEQDTSNLQEAIKSADIAKIQNLLQQNADINTPIVFENEEMSVLQYIILQPDAYPKYDVLNTIFNLIKGVAINLRSSVSGTTPLMSAVCINDTGKPATCSNCTGMTEAEAIIKLLIQNGADPFVMNSNNISPYQIISSKLNNMPKSDSSYNSLTQKLILLINNMNYTLLTIGYYLYNLSLVSLAEDLNTNLVNTQSTNVSALVSSTQYQNLIESDNPTLENIITIIKSFPSSGDWNLMHTEVQILNTIILNYIKLGGSLGAQYEGNTILTAAQSTKNNNLVNWIKRNFGKTLNFIDAINDNNLTQISESLNAGIPADTLINADGDTALIYAASKNNITLASLLLKAKANPNFENSSGQTSLSISALNNNYNLAQLILSYNANINYKNKQGQTILSQCIQANNINCFKFLIDNGVDIDLRKLGSCI